MFFSLVPTPGYNLSYLESQGIDNEWELFLGHLLPEKNGTYQVWSWGRANNTIKGQLTW